ncbi:MAG: tyrosine-type recombinase/integrase [Desulfuromonadaceae bacterium]
MKQFTERYLASLKPLQKKYVVREGRGFALQVLPTGTKTFMYIFELNKQKGYYPLGNYPAISLADARVAYIDAYKLVKKGIDPREEKKNTVEEHARLVKEAELHAEAAALAAAQLERDTFDALIAEEISDNYIPATVEQLSAVWYVKYSKENHSVRWQETVISAIKTHIIPNIGKMELASVRHKHAVSLIQKIAADVPGSARNTMKFCRQMFKYACRHEWADIQPFHEITESVPKIAQKADERHLDDDEIVKAWEEISKSSSSREVKRALKLILVTAQRPGEVAQLLGIPMNPTD